jgi:GDPmannose 4,6-dehydratase
MRILITGITGQDGSYLAEQMIAEGHDVFGLVSGSKTRTDLGWAPLGIRMILGDLTNVSSLDYALGTVKPDEIYNLAALTSPGGSWRHRQWPTRIPEVTALGALNLVESACHVLDKFRLVHASSSAIYAPGRYGVYGASKLFAHEVMKGAREGYGMHVSNAVLFSHTSIRQNMSFLARRVVRAAALGRPLALTTLHTYRSWGYAPDFMKALPLIARHSVASDWDVAGSHHSVLDLVVYAYEAAGRDWQSFVTLSDDVTRVDRQVTESPSHNASVEQLGWRPQHSFREAITLMVEEEMKHGS